MRHLSTGSSGGKWVVDPSFAAFLPFPINSIIKADDVAQLEILKNSDWWKNRRPIPATWVKSDGTRYECEIELFQMPVGTSDITIGSISYDSNNVATYTPSKEGYAITNAGVLITSAVTGSTFAGVIMADYWRIETGNENQHENFRETVLEEGDIFFIVRGGEYEVYFDGATTLGRAAIGGGTSGQFSMSSAIATGGTIAQYNTSLLENSPGRPDAKSVAWIAEAIGAAGLADVHLIPYKVRVAS